MLLLECLLTAFYFHLCTSNPELHLCLEKTELVCFKNSYFSTWGFCDRFGLGGFRWCLRFWCLLFLPSSLLYFHFFSTLIFSTIFAATLKPNSAEQNWVFCFKTQEQVGKEKRNSRILWGNVAAESPYSKAIAGIQLLHKVNIARLHLIRVFFSKSSVTWG